MRPVAPLVVHRRALDYLNLMHRVPECDLGNADAMIRHALREELRLVGHRPETIELGRIHPFEDAHEARTCLVDVNLDGAAALARVTVPTVELRAIWYFRVSVEDFAERALGLHQRPWQEASVGDLEPRHDSRVSLRLIDVRTKDVVWSAEPLATCPDVLHAIHGELAPDQREPSGGGARPGVADPRWLRVVPRPSGSRYP